MSTIVVRDKRFEISIPSSTITTRIAEMAAEINQQFSGKRPVFVVVLNGAFLFGSEVFRRFEGDCELAFIRLASYSGTQSTGNVRNLVGLTQEIRDRHVIILEDIVDTGETAVHLLDELNARQPASISFASLLFKPAALKREVKLDYVGFEVPNDFLLGFGLDYDGLGRNLNDIYKLANS
ncbi:MAG: hypoxanthine phosphoribosyltransferase [Bacteroidia bacterium]|jgi:hypoxanthine phosphoribosyltransferase|nr:hypoxanthine phosphoribosyltransferase [Bacteroidia bacterium]